MTRQVHFQGRKVQVAVETSVLPNGATTVSDVVIHPGAVAILPMVDADRICLLRNQRIVVNENLIEIPAGTLEPGENPDHAAVRELAEETGYHAAKWRKLTTFFPSPGILTERTHLYVAEQLTPGPTQLEADEVIEPLIVSWTQAVAWALDGTIRDAKTLVGILLWDRLRGK